jgi:cytidylate kinase
LVHHPKSSVNDLSLLIDHKLNIDLNGISYKDSELYSKDINAKSSEIAKEKVVRNKISESLKLLNDKLTNGLIIEGRDMGSVVFPEADLKIYLDASLEVRAKRRLQQSNESETLEDLQKRDINDMTRIESPLIIPEGSLYIDNSNIDMSEVLNLVKENLKLQ